MVHQLSQKIMGQFMDEDVHTLCVLICLHTLAQGAPSRKISVFLRSPEKKCRCKIDTKRRSDCLPY